MFAAISHLFDLLRLRLTITYHLLENMNDVDMIAELRAVVVILSK